MASSTVAHFQGGGYEPANLAAFAEATDGFAGIVDVKQNVQVAKAGLNFHIWGPGL